MRFLLIPTLLTACAVSGLAQTADRVYSADQTSKTVSVIDPATNKLLGSIHLGDDVSALTPLYHGQLPGPSFFSQQAPFDQPGISISSHDRVYTADQFSNTVSVVDPSTNTTLGVIRLGNSSPNRIAERKLRDKQARRAQIISAARRIAELRIRRTEAPEDCGFRVFRIRDTELSLGSVLLARCSIRRHLPRDCHLHCGGS